MLKDKHLTKKEKGEKLVTEVKGLTGLEKVVSKGINKIKKFIIETNSKNMALKELEINRMKNIEKIEKIYEKTNSYLIMKRLIDIANEINEKYNLGVEEIEKVYASDLNTEEKLGGFEEIISLTNAYYKIIIDDVEKNKITSS
jgi:hypothetical protein